MISFKNKRLCIFGLQDSGKTEFARWLVSKAERPFVYDLMDEYGDFDHALSYRPRYRTYSPKSINEVNRTVEFVLSLEPLPTMFFMDDANRFCPTRRPLPEQISYLNDEAMHLPMALCFIARRPVQLYTDLTELSHYIVIFSLAGKNDVAYLESVRSGLGEAVLNLNPYHFVLVDPRRNFSVYPPIPMVPGGKPKGGKQKAQISS